MSIEVARDSKVLALSSQRDSSSMKTLAIVTMMFLPGSFVAALFSIPVFNWASPNSSGIIGPHFGIYWAVTIPLTVLTLALYVLWLLFRKQEQNRLNKDARKLLDEKVELAEFRKLTMKREEISS